MELGKKVTKCIIILVLLVASILTIGCRTLSIEVREKAHCDLKVKAPHSVICTVDGKVVYEQTGSMALDLKGCGGGE